MIGQHAGYTTVQGEMLLAHIAKLLDWRISTKHKLTLQGNLLNRHSHKYSGLANSKVVSIHPSAEGSQIVIAKIKADAKPNQVNL